MFRIGLSSSGKELCPQLFENYKKAGIDMMELDCAFDSYDALDYKDVRRMADLSGVELWSFHLPFRPFDTLDISSSDKEIREHSLKYTGELFKKAADIGIDKYVVHSGATFKRVYTELLEERLKIASESYAYLAEIAGKLGGVVAVENLPPVCVGTDICEIETLISLDDRLRVCFDTNHMYSGDPADFIRHFGEKIITMHVSDFDFVKERHWLPGEGKNDWQSIYKAFCDINYKGPWLYEVQFISLPTIKRERDLTCEDFARNAREIFENNPFTIIPSEKLV